MYKNLKKYYSFLKSEDKKILLDELCYDKTRLSKKINGKYSTKGLNFNDFEKDLICNFINDMLDLNLSINELFKWEEKEQKEILTNENTYSKRFKICIERKKDFYNLNEEKIANDLNISINTLRNYKNGVTNIPITLLEDFLPKYFNVSPKFLLGIEEIPISYECDKKLKNDEISNIEIIKLLKKRIITLYQIDNETKFNNYINDWAEILISNIDNVILSNYYNDKEAYLNYSKNNKYSIEEIKNDINDINKKNFHYCVNQLWLINKGFYQASKEEIDLIIKEAEIYRKSYKNDESYKLYFSKWYFDFLKRYINK